MIEKRLVGCMAWLIPPLVPLPLWHGLVLTWFPFRPSLAPPWFSSVLARTAGSGLVVGSRAHALANSRLPTHLLARSHFRVQTFRIPFQVGWRFGLFSATAGANGVRPPVAWKIVFSCWLFQSWSCEMYALPRAFVRVSSWSIDSTQVPVWSGGMPPGRSTGSRPHGQPEPRRIMEPHFRVFLCLCMS